MIYLVKSIIQINPNPDPNLNVVIKYLCAMKILMVCLGNICRSPLAEGILQKKAFDAGLGWSVESAGTISETGSAPHHLSQKIARLNGIDICNQRARRFTADDFNVFDRIYALSSDVLDQMKRIARQHFDPSKADLLMNEAYPGEDMDVPDPWYGPEQGYHDVYKMIDEACEAIIEKYGQEIKNKPSHSER
jgi:protein-tyrosine phosphatase